MILRRWGWVLAACAAFGGCADPPPAAPHFDHPIRYRLEWRWGRATPAAGGGWQVDTDLGYRVHLLRGYVVPFSMELIECLPPRAQAVIPGVTAVFQVATMLLAPRAVYAFHSANIVNPSTMRAASVESLANPQPQELPPITPPGRIFCQTHFVIARATPDSPGLPADIDMADTSLRIDGTSSPRGGGPAMPFHVQTPAANGTLVPIRVAGTDRHEVDTRRDAPVVTIVRDLGGMFDGIDFATARAAVVEDRILTNLTQRVAVQVTLVETTVPTR